MNRKNKKQTPYVPYDSHLSFLRHVTLKSAPRKNMQNRNILLYFMFYHACFLHHDWPQQLLCHWHHLYGIESNTSLQCNHSQLQMHSDVCKGSFVCLQQSSAEISLIEQETRAQHSCRQWQEERQYHITASKFGLVIKRHRNHKSGTAVALSKRHWARLGTHMGSATRVKAYKMKLDSSHAC